MDSPADLFNRTLAVLSTTMAGPLISDLQQMTNITATAFSAGHKLLLCGNGGSAADAQHLAAEFLVRLRPNIDRAGIPAIALTMDMATMTAASNDYGFETVYERMVQTLGQSGDVLLGISTSGNSENVVRALQAARGMGITTLGFLGAGGGAALAHCDHALVVPSDETALIQIAHITAGHALAIGVEDALLASGFLAARETDPPARQVS